MSGRAKDGRLVHFEVPPHGATPRPGDAVTVRVSKSAPYYLIADASDVYEVRRTRSGDAWDRKQADSCGAPTPGSGAVNLGLPTIRTR